MSGTYGSDITFVDATATVFPVDGIGAFDPSPVEPCWMGFARCVVAVKLRSVFCSYVVASCDALWARVSSTQARHCFRHEPSREVLGKPFKIKHHGVETSLAISVWYGGFRAEAASAKQSVLNADSVHRQ